MVKSVDFAVRSGAGGISRGMVAGDGASDFIQVGQGDEISLNLRKTSIIKYERTGDDLQITLVDGRTITLSGFFQNDARLYISSDGELTPVTLEQGGEGVLYADYGQVEVIGKWSPNDQLAFLEGEDILAPEDEGVTGMAMFAPLVGLGGLGLAGAGLVGLSLLDGGDDTTDGGDDTTDGGDDTTDGGDDTTDGGDDTTDGGDDTTDGGDDTTDGGDDTTDGGDDTTDGGDDTTDGGDDTTDGGDDTTDGGDDTTDGGDDTGGGGGGSSPVVPTVDNPDARTVLTTNTVDPAATVSGTGEPGSTVTVVLGNKVTATVIGSDGLWSATFEDATFPADGDFSSTVYVTAPDGTFYELDGPDFVIDMTPPEVEITAGAASTGDVENLVEYQDGITISGTGEAGATIEVEVAGETQSTTVAADGSWSVTFATSQLPPGEYSEQMTVTATDPLGNVTKITDSLVVDTLPNPITVDTVAGDDVINAAERAGGVVVSGTSVAGALLDVTLEGVTHQVTVADDGTWSVSFSASELPAGSYASSIEVSSTDAAGNSSVMTYPVEVDTEAMVAFDTTTVTADDVVNAAEAQAGFVLSGTSEPGTVSVTVTLGGVAYAATPAADGSWSVTVTGTTSQSAAAGSGTVLASGGYLATVTATDAAGNTATDTRTVSFDTSTKVSFDATQAGDGVINAAERAAGVVLTGTAEPGASVVVAFGSGTRTVTAAADGTWSASFAASEIGTGTTSATATVTATDPAGNTATASQVIAIDTEVTNLTHTTPTPNARIADGVVSAAEGAAGLVVTGTVEPGATVTVQLASGSVVTALVAADGSWTATIPASQLPTVETDDVLLTVTATDANGNTQTQTSTVDFDPLVTDFVSAGSVTADNIVNAEEAEDGFAITGTVEPGATVTVALASGAVASVVAGADGLWSVTFDTGDLTGTAGTMGYQITAVDTAGNSTGTSGSFSYDLVAPDSPDIIAFTRDAGALLGIRTDLGESPYEISAVDAAGTVTEVADEVTLRTSYASYDFESSVPNGSYLVVTDHDTAGNESSTLLVVDNTSAVTVDLTRSGLTSFDFGTIDLNFAPEAQLTITEQQLLALTGADHTLVISGDALDAVTALGAQDTNQDTVIGGESYSIYTLGSEGATLIIDDDITNLTI